MADTTAIEWCDSTFNPWIGCTKVSPACDDCYAARSTPARTLGIQWGPHAERRRTAPSTWKQPKAWERQHADFFAQHGRRRRVFCASLADVFDNQVPVQWRMDLFSLIAETPHLDWLILTKRIGNVMPLSSGDSLMFDMLGRNVWLGATVCNQAEADRDIPKLLAVPARVRFLSIEPMLEFIELGLRCENWSDDVVMDPETGAYECCRACDHTGMGNAIDWVICGGESGQHARPMRADWARDLRDQCRRAEVAFLFKQWGEWLPAGQDGAPDRDMQEVNASDAPLRVGKAAAGRLLDGRTHDEFPQTMEAA